MEEKLNKEIEALYKKEQVDMLKMKTKIKKNQYGKHH